MLTPGGAYVASGVPVGEDITPSVAPVDFVRTEAVLDALPALVAARMDYLGASYREVGRQAGVSFSTVHRFVEGGNDPSFRAAKHLVHWLTLTTPEAEQ